VPELIEDIINALLGLPPTAVYTIIGVLAGVENVFPPVPADTAVAIGAFLSAGGRISAQAVFAVTWIANVVGAIMVYAAGRTIGRPFFQGRLGRHASNNARWTTRGTFCVEAMPTHRLSSSAKMPAATDPPILATADAASACTALCSSVGVFSTISRSRSSADGDASCPTAKTASRCTVESGSDISLSNIRAAAGFPIRPMAKAAWLRTMGSGCRAAARNKAPVKRLVSCAARIPANASMTASSCARSGGATQDTSITLKTHRIRYGRQKLPPVPGDRRDGMLESTAIREVRAVAR